jgi:2-polyprenyl-3-methyl-5-hydroxy-6-metoxy-1,4-benzoquinol methylase
MPNGAPCAEQTARPERWLPPAHGTRLVGVTGDLRNVVDGTAERVVFEDLSSTVYGAEHLARYLFAAQWAAGRCVADLCCGTGYGSNVLFSAGAIAAHGFDVSEPAIREAKQRFGRPGLEFARADVTSALDIDGSRLRVCFEGLEHVANAGALLDNMARGLGDGVAIVSTPNGDAHPSGHSGNPHHVREYGFADFDALMRSRFRDVRMYFQWRYPDPHDVEWSAAETVRALVPIALKHRLRARRGRSAASAAGGPAAGVFVAADFRPLPATYLRLPPGLRYGDPSIWIAVCQGT